MRQQDFKDLSFANGGSNGSYKGNVLSVILRAKHFMAFSCTYVHQFGNLFARAYRQYHTGPDSRHPVGTPGMQVGYYSAWYPWLAQRDHPLCDELSKASILDLLLKVGNFVSYVVSLMMHLRRLRSWVHFQLTIIQS